MLIVALIFVFLAVWIALYLLVIRPKLETFRYTAGIYQAIDAFEGDVWAQVKLRLAGVKVAILGAISSAAPVLVILYDQISNVQWGSFLPDTHAKIIVGVLAGVGVLGPVLMAWLHQNAIADAAATPPAIATAESRTGTTIADKVVSTK